jgi:CubicO group peptidase (beta-lactamase class C family)
MNRAIVFVVTLAACGAPRVDSAGSDRANPPPSSSEVTQAPVELPATSEVMSSDGERETRAGTRFIAPAGFTLTQRGEVTIVEAPERDSRVAFIEVEGVDADAAVNAAWSRYLPDRTWPLASSTARSNEDGWTERRIYIYRTSPNEKRSVRAAALRRKEGWTVWIRDVADATGERRAAQFNLMFDRLYPRGYSPETFAGRKPKPLDESRIALLSDFIEKGQTDLGVPGVAVGIIQDGKTVLARGFGVRELGKPPRVDADTLFMIASNTKAMTTLMLGKLVDQQKIKWDSQVKSLLPEFRLADSEITSKVLVKHLICACTGLPRQDTEWLLQFDRSTPLTILDSLATMKPTSGFGDVFQYSNPLAAAAGFVGGRVYAPKRELGKAYDDAMQGLVFGPLSMKSTTFDFKKALASNHASPHALDMDARVAKAVMDVNYAVAPLRPAGGAWSSVNDVLKYVAMELDGGLLPNGKRYVSQDVLGARRTPQVVTGRDGGYGMGLSIDVTDGTQIIHHGGALIGFKSDMLWLPEHRVGAVVLTNAETGNILVGGFQRKLLEVLFDGESKADGRVTARAKSIRESLAAERKVLSIPADPTAAAALAARYEHPALGAIVIKTSADATVFDFGEWRTPVASKKNPDGSTSFISIVPGMIGWDFLVGRDGKDKKTLTFRDAQHEYSFIESPAP